MQHIMDGSTEQTPDLINSNVQSDDEDDLYCEENIDEILEDIDMSNELDNITVLDNTADYSSVDDYDMYPSFTNWGTNESPFIQLF